MTSKKPYFSWDAYTNLGLCCGFVLSLLFGVIITVLSESILAGLIAIPILSFVIGIMFGMGFRKSGKHSFQVSNFTLWVLGGVYVCLIIVAIFVST